MLLRKLFPLLALIIVVNSLVMAVFLLQGFDWADEARYSLYDSEFKSVLNRSRELFLNKSIEEWADAREVIESEYDVLVSFVEPNDTFLSSDIVERLSSRIHKNGVIVPEEATVYLQLDNQHILMAELISSGGIGDYLVEIILYLALLSSTLVAISYYYSQKFQAELAVKKQLVKTEDFQQLHNQDMAQLVSQLKGQQEQLTEAYNRQLSSHKDLLHGVAHELRSPMARIQFALDMMPENEDNQFLEMRDLVDQNLKELDSLIAELLAFARLQHSGKTSFNDQVDLAELCGVAVNKIKNIYNKVEFSIEVNLTHHEINANYTQLSRALVNLLRNAGRYAKNQCITRVYNEADNLVLCVEDDGEGIPPGKRERIFEPFTRLDPSRSRDSGGSGLGLAIVKSVVELHQGSVVAEESELGGAKFQITLPLAIKAE